MQQIPEGMPGDPFEPFVLRRSTDHSGLGLGLSIAREAVRAHLGDITIHNRPPVGCMFRVSIARCRGDGGGDCVVARSKPVSGSKASNKQPGSQTWSIPTECPECQGHRAEPTNASTVNSELIIVSVRCSDCAHTWTLHRRGPLCVAIAGSPAFVTHALRAVSPSQLDARQTRPYSRAHAHTSSPQARSEPPLVPAKSRRRRGCDRGGRGRATLADAAQQGSQNPPAAGTVAPIRVPAEFAAATAAAPVTFEFPMTGAQVFARACKEEGVAALFACPGNYRSIHALAAAGIPAYGGRHEGSMAHAADAFIRVTGEIAVASGTEGPGFTDMICAIACANAARTPLLSSPATCRSAQEDTEAGIQLGYQQPTTEGLKKYGKRLIIPRRVHEYAGYAFRQLQERRAGAGAPRLPGRGRVRALQGRHRARVLPRQDALPHRLAAASVAERHRQGRRDDRKAAAARSSCRATACSTRRRGTR